MYIVGLDRLPEQERTDEAVEYMAETLSWAMVTPYIKGLNFTGEVYKDTDSPTQFKVLSYTGLVTSIISEPPSFNVLVSEACQQVAECDCPGGSFDKIFEDFGLAMEEAQLSAELDQLAGTETKDPHFVEVSLPAKSEITIRFDRLGAYGVNGVFRQGLGTA